MSRGEGRCPERPAFTAAEGDLGVWPLISAKFTSPKQPTSCCSTGPPPRLCCLFSGQTPAFSPASPCRPSCSVAWPYLDDPQGFAGIVFVQVVDVARQGDAEEVVLLPQAAQLLVQDVGAHGKRVDNRVHVDVPDFRGFVSGSREQVGTIRTPADLLKQWWSRVRAFHRGGKRLRGA